MFYKIYMYIYIHIILNNDVSILGSKIIDNQYQGEPHDIS